MRKQKKSPDFVQLFGNVDNLALLSLESLRDRVKTWMDDVGKELSPANFKAVSDAFLKLDLKIATKDPFGELKGSMKEIRATTKEVEDAQIAYNKALNEGGDTKGADEKLKQAQTLRGIAVATAQQSLSTAAADGKQIVGAAKEVTNIMGSFGVKIPAEILGVIDGMGQMMDGLASINLTNPMSIVTGSIKVIGGLVKSITSIFNGDNKKEQEIQALQKKINALKKSYDNLDKAINKAYGADAGPLIEQQNALLEQQKVLLRNQLEAEKSKKNADDGKMQAIQDQIDEIDEVTSENKEKIKESFFGSDIKSAIDEFANAYADAWSKGGDKAKAMKDVAKKAIKDVIMQMIMGSAGLGDTVEKIRGMIEGFFGDGVVDENEQKILDNYIDKETKRIDGKYGWADRYMKDDTATEAEREASSKGFASMSQDSADELNGRFTAMQGMLFDVRDNMVQMFELQRQNLPQLHHLTHLSVISDNTAYCRRLEGIEVDMRAMKNCLEDMNIKGIKIR